MARPQENRVNSISTELRVKELLREKGWTTKVLAEKTGMSESYLTHIKNGTRRWNEDSLRKLAYAFELGPIDLFAHRRKRTDNPEAKVALSDKVDIELKVQVIPVVGDIPSQPSPFNNQLTQVTTGYKDVFVPILNHKDTALFAYAVTNNSLAPVFNKGDYLIVSPGTWTHSGDIAAVEYGSDSMLVKAVMRVTYSEDLVVLESLNSKQAPIALMRGKEQFRVIGRVIGRHQNLE
ncbi:MAG TPA: S24 family peptidase [Candidatus Babeliales bacterium]|nr:S24 family peptidase [Candidatus Babeliales bacterium]